MRQVGETGAGCHTGWLSQILYLCKKGRSKYIMYMLRMKRGFVQSQDYPAQTLDPCLVVQSMDWPCNPGIARAQCIDQTDL